MLVVTGADGFIGSNVVSEWRRRGHGEMLAVDQYDSLAAAGESCEASTLPPLEARYTAHAPGTLWLDFHDLPDWLARHGAGVEAIVHLGACSDTTVSDRRFVMENNFAYTARLWNWCVVAGRPLVYASSAATYGDGRKGYDDRIDPARYRPLNLYGESKHTFDVWALRQSRQPPHWAGVKYFNVYGPNEQHKGRMASVALHCFHQIQQAGRVRLFQSHREDVPDGGQQRDFVYVLDAVDATLFLLQSAAPNGLYNVGSGRARTFADLARAVFAAVDQPPQIEYIPMPADLRGRYQYFTQADVGKLREAGFSAPLHSLEAGVRDYVQCHLLQEVLTP